MPDWMGNANPDNVFYGLLFVDPANTPGTANIALWKNEEFTGIKFPIMSIFN
jgi:peptide/nickel transport system substrate-binding protein